MAISELVLIPLAPAAAFPVEFLHHDTKVLWHLQRILRTWPLLQRDWDVDDFRQELLARLHARQQAGQLSNIQPDQVDMVWKRIADQVAKDQLRYLMRRQRDARRRESIDTFDFADPGVPDPSRNLEQEEILAQAKSLLSERDWNLLDLCSQGFTWVEIARMVGGQPNSLRIRHTRILMRLADKIG